MSEECCCLNVSLLFSLSLKTKSLLCFFRLQICIFLRPSKTEAQIFTCVLKLNMFKYQLCSNCTPTPPPSTPSRNTFLTFFFSCSWHGYSYWSFFFPLTLPLLKLSESLNHFVSKFMLFCPFHFHSNCPNLGNMLAGSYP